MIRIVETKATNKGIKIIPGNRFSINLELNTPVNNPEHNHTTIIPVIYKNA